MQQARIRRKCLYTQLLFLAILTNSEQQLPACKSHSAIPFQNREHKGAALVMRLMSLQHPPGRWIDYMVNMGLWVGLGYIRPQLGPMMSVAEV